MHGQQNVKKNHNCCQDLIKLECSRQTFYKYSNVRLKKKQQVAADVFHADGRTGVNKRNDKTNSRFWQFFERA